MQGIADQDRPAVNPENAAIIMVQLRIERELPAGIISRSSFLQLVDEMKLWYYDIMKVRILK